MESIVVLPPLRHRAMFVLVVALLIVTNTTTFMYATRLFNSAEPVQRTNTRALELGSVGKMMQFSSISEQTQGDPTIPDEHMESGENKAPTTSTSDCTPCDCKDPEITKIVYEVAHEEYPAQQQEQSLVGNKTSDDAHMKTIFIITPTYHRSTQKIDLNSMCHTLMSVPKVVWIIIEDSSKPTGLVTRLIQRCKVKIVHLVVPTSSIYKQKKGKPWQNLPRGVEQRNAGLNWLRDNYSLDHCNGAFYFGDDDNKYDLRLFEDIRNTRTASVWKVAWAGGLQWEGPTCRNGKATSWHSYFAANKRVFPLDMAGFAVHLCQLFKNPKARVGVDIHGHTSRNGFLETDFLQHFATKSTVECCGSETEVENGDGNREGSEYHHQNKAKDETRNGYL
ncbi:Galactosylgalactosylxylosylprotein 3-beta-glucuronosyltransferase 2 [Geodia barretti]|uniref:Galactosylgalactosylxylosylprotein 3-beta-glucuronosyltransferase n=1 Tax=Geodia barretti TaxID=519541 RepID=A0AA35WUQ1_GEOBA|nr:Galactosylgalactosylxylosylprotein 3-beta-glucuronosyltransferase 2 [Geodia barretti]